jgi:hypothetical protein
MVIYGKRMLEFLDYVHKAVMVDLLDLEHDTYLGQDPDIDVLRSQRCIFGFGPNFLCTIGGHMFVSIKGMISEILSPDQTPFLHITGLKRSYSTVPGHLNTEKCCYAVCLPDLADGYLWGYDYEDSLMNCSGYDFEPAKYMRQYTDTRKIICNGHNSASVNAEGKFFIHTADYITHIALPSKAIDCSHITSPSRFIILCENGIIYSIPIISNSDQHIPLAMASVMGDFPSLSIDLQTLEPVENVPG